METSSFNKNNINLLVLERWLETKIQETLNPLVSIIENEIKGKQMNENTYHTTTYICYILVLKWWEYPECCEMLLMFGRSQNFRL